MTADIVLIPATDIQVGDFCQSGERITGVKVDPNGVTVTWEQSTTIPCDTCLYVIRDTEVAER